MVTFSNIYNNDYNKSCKTDIAKESDTIIYNIDSKHRNISMFSNSAKFKVKLKEPIKNATYIKILSFELPFKSDIPELYHNFNDSIRENTNFIIHTNYTNYVIKIPNNTYNINTLVDTINEIIRNKELNITVSYDKYKITFESNTLFNLNFLETSTGYLTLGQILGFKYKYYCNITKITGDNYVNIPSDNYFLLKLNDYGYIRNILYNDYNKDCKNDIIDSNINLVSFNIIIDNKSYIVNIPTVSYTITTLITQIQKLIQEQNINIEISLLPNNKVQFISEKLFSLYFPNIKTGYPSIKNILGFENNNINNVHEITSNGVCYIPDSNYLINYINSTNQDINNEALFSKVVLNKNCCDNIITKDNQFTFKTPTTIMYFDIEIITPFLKIAKFNNIDYSFTIEIGKICTKN